mmetsp:Transcript_8456/g.29021  ORF Transcript_8456/g.29021 Transcript_8456/m.29021 type:complete len:201 (+) Transcript_8456:2818-3420(+)
MQLDLSGDLPGGEGVVHPLLVEVVQRDCRPGALDGALRPRNALHRESVRLPPPQRDLLGVLLRARLGLHGEALAARPERLHAKAVLAVEEGDPPLLRLANVENDPLQHLAGHAAAVIHHADPFALLAHKDVHLDLPFVRPEGLSCVALSLLCLVSTLLLDSPVKGLRVVDRIIDELHEHARCAGVPFGHVVQQQGGPRYG